MKDLTYDSHSSSGHSGTDTSEERATRYDADGTTQHTQTRILRLVVVAREQGVTIAEIRRAIPDHHHGTLSGALTNMHRGGTLARLADKRVGCKIYVAPEFIDGRDTEAPNTRRDLLQDLVDKIEEMHGMEILINRVNGTTMRVCKQCRGSWPCETADLITAHRATL